MHRAKIKVQAAADTAVLHAINLALAHDKAKNIQGNYKKSESSFEPIRVAIAGFNASVADANRSEKLTITITVERKDGIYSGKVSFGGDYKTIVPTFGPTLAFGGIASASFTAPTSAYFDINLVLDMSGSMGIGASQGDIDKLRAQNGCAFVCHGHNTRAPGSKLRIDVLREAVISMIDIAKEAKGETGERIRIGMASFNHVNEKLAPLSANYSSLKTAAQKIDVTPAAAGSGTNIGAAIAQQTLETPASGNGSAKDKRKQFVFLVSDGLEDRHANGRAIDFPMPYAGAGDNRTGTMDPEKCSALKKKGVTVGVIYTTRYNIGQHDEYYVPLLPFIPDRMKKCASPGYYFAAQDGNAIKSALKELFSKASKDAMVHLTQ